MFEKKEGWFPEDMKGVEWVMERVFEHRCEINALEARKKALVENIDAMIAEHRRDIDALMHLYSGHLERIVRMELSKSKSKAKHIKTPFGRLGFRKSPDSLFLEVSDGEAVAWAEAEHPEIVRKHVNKTDLANVGAPFIKVIPGEESFYVDVRAKEE